MNDGKVAFLDERRGIKNGGSDGGNGDIRERLSALEAEFKHLATKTDISNLKVWILGGLIAGLFAGIPSAVAILVLVLKYFPK